MVTAAKTEFSRAKQQQRKTGGGRLPAPIKETSQRIIDLFKDEPSFSGIPGGIEFGRFIYSIIKIVYKSVQWHR